MILYVNGDSHAAAAEAVNSCSWAEDDSSYFFLGHAPHPDNLQVSWGRLLSLAMRAALHCDAEAGSSNDRIIRTTRQWLEQHDARRDVLVVIGWSTWEREEWLHDGSYYQVNASGIDQVPPALQEKYRHYIMSIDWQEKTAQAHEQIWSFHKELDKQKIPHVFFNCNSDFAKISKPKRWGKSYISPYDGQQTYDAVLRANGFETVAPKSWHFGKDAHSFFSRFLLQYVVDNKLI
jgi:hypothetical protein